MKLDRRLLRLVQTASVALALTIGLGLGGGLLTVGQARVLSRIVERVFLGGQTLTTVFEPGEVSGLFWILLSLIAARAVFAWGMELSAHAVAARIKADLRQRVFEHLLALGPLSFYPSTPPLPLPIAKNEIEGDNGEAGAAARATPPQPFPNAENETEREGSGELVNTVTEGIEALDAYFSQYLPQLVLAALVPLSVLAFVFPVDLLSGFVLLVTAPLIPVFMVLIGSVAEDLTHQQWRTLSRMSAYFLDVLQGLTTLKILGRSREQLAVIARVSEAHRQATMSVLRVTFLSALTLELVSTLSTAVVAVEIGLRLLYGRLSFEQAFFVLILAPEFYLPLRLLGTRFHAGMAGTAAAGRLFEILDRPRPENRSQAGDRSPAPLVKGAAPTIVFDRVSYTYPDGRPALEDVSFTLPAGKTTALVGPSGAGKSTVASLLLGFIEPDSGQIRGIQPSGAAARLPIAWISQTPYLFHDTVAANLRLAKPEAAEEEIVAAARLAHADEFIRQLPEGYATIVGERGARLSGGQAQRLALARAFLKDAPVLVLDEATSALDPVTEDQLCESIERLKAGRTVLVIAHRRATVALADQIVELEGGRRKDEGGKGEGEPRRHEEREGGGLWSAGEGGRMKEGLSTDGKRTNGPERTGGKMKENVALPPSRFVIVRLLGLLAPFGGLVALSVLLGAATIGSGIGLMATSAYIIARAALHPSVAVLQVAIVGVRFFGITRGGFRYLERLVSHEVTLRVLARLRAAFYRAVEPLAPARLIGYQSGDLLSRAIGDIASLEGFYVRAIAPPLVAVLVAVGISLYLGQFAPALAGTLLVFLALAGAGVPLVTRLFSRLPGRQLVEARARLNVTLLDGIQGMADLLVFEQAHRQQAKVAAAGNDLAAAQRRMAFLQGFQTALEVLLANLGMAAVLGLAIPLVQAGRFEGVYLPVLALAALSSFEAVQPLPLAAQYLESNLAAARRLFELADRSPAAREPADPKPAPETLGVEVTNLSFSYPGRASGPPGAALQGISFILPAGKRMAVVGPSGAGKSTLVSLILRFWDFTEGEIRLGGIDIRQIPGEELRRSLAVVAQNTYLFNSTLRENLMMARPEATEEELIQAARAAQIYDFIQALPQGYDTWVGEQGLRLSGGERQRVAIARALLKNTPLLILDEPTANLDGQTEEEVLTAIRTLMAGRTTLVITHRLVGLDGMDEILVLDGGQIVERGGQADLIARGGLYRRMWAAQSQIFSAYPIQLRS